MTLTEKVAYIKGLVAALETDKNDKVFSAVLDLLSDLFLCAASEDDFRRAFELKALHGVVPPISFSLHLSALILALFGPAEKVFRAALARRICKKDVPGISA